MPSDPIRTPRLKRTPALPPDGIFFDMPFETYLAAPAVGSSLGKDVLTDPLLAWNHSWLNPHFEEKDKAELLYGKAFHTRLLEGREAFDELYYVEPAKADYDDLLVTDADISAAIEQFEVSPVKGNKPERVKQLLDLWGEAPVWDEIVARAQRDAGNRTAIKATWADKFEQSAAFLEADEELRELVRGGVPEVSLFWHCPRTGIPKKARADVLRIEGIVDVKTFANMHRKSLGRAIPRAIANEQYPFQASWYLEGAAVVRQLVQAALERGDAGLPIHQPVATFDQDKVDFAKQWAEHDAPDRWWWLFVQKGDAPSVVGVEYDVEGMLREQFDGFCNGASEELARLFDEYGVRPWVEQHGIWRLEDNQIPAYILEI